MDRIALASGAKVCPKIELLSDDMLGFAGVVQEVSIGNDGEKFVVIEECTNPKTSSFLIRGGNRVACEEIETSLRDCIACVKTSVKDPRIVIGGGATEAFLAVHTPKYLEKLSPLHKYIAKSWAASLWVIPETLAENAGMKPAEVVAKLKKAHNSGLKTAGVNINEFDVGDLSQLVWEPYTMKQSLITLATEMTCSILKIDQLIQI
jgi:chaperonin GroEL (HSP60 family)